MRILDWLAKVAGSGDFLLTLTLSKIPFKEQTQTQNLISHITLVRAID